MGHRFVDMRTIHRRMREKDERMNAELRRRLPPILAPEPAPFVEVAIVCVSDAPLTLTVSVGGDDLYIAEVSGIPLGPGLRWTAQAEQRRIAEGELLRRFPDAVVTGAATANDHAYILWFKSELVA